MLEPHLEEHEENAEVGEDADVFYIAYEVGAVRAQHDARKKEARDEGEVEAAEYRYGYRGDREELQGLCDAAYDCRVGG